MNKEDLKKMIEDDLLGDGDSLMNGLDSLDDLSLDGLGDVENFEADSIPSISAKNQLKQEAGKKVSSVAKDKSTSAGEKIKEPEKDVSFAEIDQELQELTKPIEPAPAPPKMPTPAPSLLEDMDFDLDAPLAPKANLEPDPKSVTEPRPEPVAVASQPAVEKMDPVSSSPSEIAAETPDEPVVETFTKTEQSDTIKELLPQNEIQESNVTETATAGPPEETVNIKPFEFPDLDDSLGGNSFELDFFANIPVTIDVQLGQANLSLKDVYDLAEGTVIELEKLYGEPVELKVNGELVGLGEVVAVDQNYGIMLKEVIHQKK